VIEHGKYYTGTWTRFDIVKIGAQEKMAFQVLADFGEHGELATTCWMGNTPGKDGMTNNDRIFERLIEFGCDRQRLVGPGWSDHIQMTMAGKHIAAKAEEYNGRTNLKGLYLPGSGGGKPANLTSSPFVSAIDDDTPF
jgi:hypothetical protein